MRILSIDLETNNLDETKTFYAEVMGLEILHTDPLSITFSAGDSKLIFHYAENSEARYHFAFNIPYESVDESLSMFKEKVKILPLPESGDIVDFADWKAKSFYFFDNNGNILECIGRREYELTAEQQISNNGIVNISEIGVAVSNVLRSCKDLQRQYGLQYFPKQEPAKQFAAMGSDDGLLIFTEIDRNWFLTNIPAKRYPLKVELDLGDTNLTLRW